MGNWPFGRLTTAQAGAVLAPARRARLSSPWAPGMSANILAADWLGANADLFPVTREQAMKVAAVNDARNLICLPFVQAVLKAYRNDAQITTPAWCYRTDGDMPPQMRLLHTMDDLFFTGFSLWEVARGSNGAIGDAARVLPDRWDWDEDWRILIDEQPVQARDVVLFTGWDDGILLSANKAIRHEIDLSDEVARRVRVPQAHTTLKMSEPDAFDTEADAKAFVAKYAADRRDPLGAVSLLPYGVETEQGGEAPVSLYENGRNAAVLDIARHSGVPGVLLDASGTSASLTYQTVETARYLLNDRIRARAAVIEARLSMDDVCSRGTRIAVDLSAITGPETGTAAPTED